MRVAYTLEQCWHRVPGGTATAALEVARALRDGGEVELVGVSASHRAPAPEPWVPPVPVRSLPLPRTALYESWLRWRRPRVERATGPVDVVHATTIVVPPRSAPLVVTIHDLAFVHEPGHFTARGVRVMTSGLDATRRDADLVLCSSSATLEDCEAAGISVDRLRLVPLGVDTTRVDVDTARQVARRLGLDRPFLLFAGTLEPRKNLAALLAAYRRLDPVQDLAVAGPAGWGDDLAAEAAALGRRVHLLGFVPTEDLRALYAAADAFCYPSLREGFGLPVLEAMAQGTPVVTSRGTSTEEVAAGAAELVDPTDVDDIARGIDAALAGGERLRPLGLARAAAMSWRTTASLTLAAYREVAP